MNKRLLGAGAGVLMSCAVIGGAAWLDSESDRAFTVSNQECYDRPRADRGDCLSLSSLEHDSQAVRVKTVGFIGGAALIAFGTLAYKEVHE